jgi:hypothetical protein
VRVEQALDLVDERRRVRERRPAGVAGQRRRDDGK